MRFQLAQWKFNIWKHKTNTDSTECKRTDYKLMPNTIWNIAWNIITNCLSQPVESLYDAIIYNVGMFGMADGKNFVRRNLHANLSIRDL